MGIKVVYILAFAAIYCVLLFRQYRHSTLSPFHFFGLFFIGLAIKGGAAIYLARLYFPFGDAYEYFHNSQVFGLFTNYSFKEIMEIWFLSSDNWSASLDELKRQFYPHILFDTDSFTFVKLTYIISLFGWKNHFITAFLFGAISNWVLFQILTTLFKKYQINLYLLFGLIFGLPSLALWTSGILKDTVAIWGLCSLLLAFLNSNSRPYLLLLGSTVLLLFKPYLFILLAFCYGIYWLFQWFQSKGYSILLTLPSIIGIMGIIGVIITFLPDHLGQYNLEGIHRYIHDIENWNTRPGQNTSFHYGDQNWNTFKLIYIAPIAIITALFRPFIWETSTASMLLMALESIALLGLTIIAFKVQIWTIIREQKQLLPLVLFILGFAYWLGLTTFNFGALSRYRTPLLFAIVILVVLVHKKRPSTQS